jgi:ketosteroid isomerase-like protein
MESDTNKDIVIRFVKAINDHDVDGIINLMSEDHIFIDATGHKSIDKKE